MDHFLYKHPFILSTNHKHDISIKSAPDLDQALSYLGDTEFEFAILSNSKKNGAIFTSKSEQQLYTLEYDDENDVSYRCLSNFSRYEIHSIFMDFSNNCMDWHHNHKWEIDDNSFLPTPQPPKILTLSILVGLVITFSWLCRTLNLKTIEQRFAVLLFLIFCALGIFIYIMRKK